MTEPSRADRAPVYASRPSVEAGRHSQAAEAPAGRPRPYGVTDTCWIAGACRYARVARGDTLRSRSDVLRLTVGGQLSIARMPVDSLAGLGLYRSTPGILRPSTGILAMRPTCPTCPDRPVGKPADDAVAESPWAPARDKSFLLS